MSLKWEWAVSTWHLEAGWLCLGPITKILHFGLSSAQLCTFKLSMEKQIGHTCQLKSPNSFITLWHKSEIEAEQKHTPSSFPSLNFTWKTIPELCEVNTKKSVISSKHCNEYEQSLSVTVLPIADIFVSLPQPSLLHHSAETMNKALRYTSQQMLLTMKFIWTNCTNALLPLTERPVNELW